MLIEFFKCIFTECVFALYFVTCLSIQFNFIELLLSTTRIFSHCCRIYLFLINNGFSNSEGLPDNSEVKKKNPHGMQERQVRVWSLDWEGTLQEELDIHSSILTWKIPWTEEPGGLPFIGSHRVRRDWAHTHSNNDVLCLGERCPVYLSW